MAALPAHEAGDAYDPFAGGTLARVLPASEAQREVWLADRLGREASLAFNESVTLRLAGALDADALQAALAALVQRHEALRATLGDEGAELLIADAQDIALPLADLEPLAPAAREAALAEAADAAVQQPFDLERGPLLRAALYRLDADAHALLLTAHHIVCDGWSWGVLVEDLGALYAERLGQAPAPEPAAQYGDYLAWEAAEAAGPAQAAAERYWLGRYAGGTLPVLDLPTDRPRPAQRGFASARIDHRLDAGLVAALKPLAGRLGCSVYALLFSGFAATLARLAGQDDLVVGVPAAGQSASGLASLVGHCIHLLPVRVAVDAEQPFEQHGRHTASALLDAFEHQGLTYGALLRKLPLARDPARLPLVSVMFNVDQAVASRSEAYPGLAVTLAANPRRYENFELFVNAVAVDGGLRLECQYATALFDAATVERWLVAYETLLRAALDDASRPLGRLPLVDAAGRAALAALQPPPVPLPAEALMHAAVQRQCRATPERIAVSFGAERLRYADLDADAHRLAQALRRRGVARGARVGLCLPRTPRLLVALLAVLRAGASYVPLDPAFPAARLADCAEDAALDLLVTESGVAQAPLAWRADAAARVLRLDDGAWRHAPAEPLAPSAELDARPGDPAYVIYTSGSTGRPKGVEVPHRAVANFLASMAASPGLDAGDRLAAVTTLAFDIAVLELLLPLGVGAQVVLVPRETAMDGQLLQGLLAESGATLMQATPGLWRMLVDAGWHGAPGFRALVGGEALPPDLAAALMARCAAVWNLYGPTETTVWSTTWQVQPETVAQRGMAIGRPIANTQVWVLDERLEPCPVGVPGELCIGGAGVALGYVGRPELTAERFVADPRAADPAARLYRTGDRGRWRNDGLLEHLGRLDLQVKLRGYRIELGEIEARCGAVEGVAACVASVREDTPGDMRLVAYLVPDGAQDGDALRANVLAALRGRLPDYMLPQHLVLLDALPRLPNGKLDRKALPAPQADPAPAADRVAPRNDLEREVLAAMEEVLKLPGLSLTDDFFALGGHSLLAARLTARLNRALGLQLPLRTLFEAPTAERLARAVAAAREAGSAPRAPLTVQPDRRRAPLTPMQERIRFVEELHPGRVVYNTPSAHRLRGPLDRAAFEAALREVVRRQPALRTCIAPAEGGGREQHIAPDLAFELPCEDLSGLPGEVREAELMRRMQALVDVPLDIQALPLFRCALYRLGEDEHAFFFMPHHVVFDGWSFDLLYEELAACYGALSAGRAPALPPLPATYGDYAEWQADWLRGPECARQLAYWKQRLARQPVPRAPRSDRPRRAGMSGEGAAEWVRIDGALVERLRGVARSADATLNMLTMAVYAALLADAIDSPAIVVGVPVRGRLMAEVEPVMGFFNNLLPVQLDVPRDVPVVDFVRGLKRELLEVFGNDGVPYEHLATEPEAAARAQGAGLYQALFSFQDARERQRRWGALQQSTILIFQKGATEDLGLWLMEVPGGLEGGFIYNADLYTAETARAFRTRYLELLARLADDPALSLAALLDAAGSDAARHLRRLAGAPHVAAAEGAAEAAARPALPASGPALAGDALALATVWAGLLDLEPQQLRADDNFFDLGGDSLLAMQAVEQSERALGFRVDARRYIYESLGQLAAREAATPRLVASSTPRRSAEPAPAPAPRLFDRVFAGFGRKAR